MNVSDLLSEIVRRNVSSLESGAALREVPGWDSLKGVRLVLRLEEIVGRELTENEVEGLRRISDIEAILSKST